MNDKTFEVLWDTLTLMLFGSGEMPTEEEQNQAKLWLKEALQTVNPQA